MRRYGKAKLTGKTKATIGIVIVMSIGLFLHAIGGIGALMDSGDTNETANQQEESVEQQEANQNEAEESTNEKENNKADKKTYKTQEEKINAFKAANGEVSLENGDVSISKFPDNANKEFNSSPQIKNLWRKFLKDDIGNMTRVQYRNEDVQKLYMVEYDKDKQAIKEIVVYNLKKQDYSDEEIENFKEMAKRSVNRMKESLEERYDGEELENRIKDIQEREAERLQERIQEGKETKEKADTIDVNISLYDLLNGEVVFEDVVN